MIVSPLWFKSVAKFGVEASDSFPVHQPIGMDVNTGSLKVKIKRHLVEHLLEQHGVEQVEAGEVRETTELVLTQEENEETQRYTTKGFVV